MTHKSPNLHFALVVFLVIATAGIGLLGPLLRTGSSQHSESPSSISYADQCANGEGWACGRAGWLQKQRGASEEALTYFEAGCDLDDGWSCAQYAYNMRPELEHGDGDVMVEALRKGCRAENSWACMKLGSEYVEGVFVPQDTLLASYLFRTSCADGEAHACFHLGKLYDDAGQFDLGDPYYVAACEQGMLFSCGVAGSRMRTAQPDKSAAMLQKACAGKIEWACE